MRVSRVWGLQGIWDFDERPRGYAAPHAATATCPGARTPKLGSSAFRTPLQPVPKPPSRTSPDILDLILGQRSQIRVLEAPRYTSEALQHVPGTQKAHQVVIGGCGVAGASTAMHLAERGAKAAFQEWVLRCLIILFLPSTTSN